MNKRHVFLQLLRRDLISFKREIFIKVFDSTFLLFTFLIVFGYFMSNQGLSTDYGPFILISSIASFGFFDTVNKISNLMTDIEGDKTISYMLTLPFPSWMAFIYTGIYWALNSTLITIYLFPFGKLILFKQFDLGAISYLRLIPMYITINLFYGFFSIWMTSMLRNVGGLGNLWVRVINPLIMFGAYFNSWDAMYSLSPTIAYICLANPLVYVMEGMRAAALGQEGFLPFWICFLILWGFILFCAWHGTRRLLKRLDCVR